MPATPREIVTRCLRNETPPRMPRHTWVLPWAAKRFPAELARLRERFPDDIGPAAAVYHPSTRSSGDAYAIGSSVDDWGCTFHNLQEGVIGEVRDPLIADLGDAAAYEPPYEQLPTESAAVRQAAIDTVNRSVAASDLFINAACCPRPWERYQFLRGSANAMFDLLADQERAIALIQKIHAYYMRELEFWAQTDVNGLMFMDDWGSQVSLLIDPELWRQIFKPLYRDYCDLAHANGKLIFMHSDGCISSIYSDLIEVGVDALNSQLFTMDMADLQTRAKGKITFWGEIDRQHIMPERDPEIVRAAVRRVASHLYSPTGGIIAQFEFGPGAHAPNAELIYEEWDRIQAEHGVNVQPLAASTL